MINSNNQINANSSPQQKINSGVNWADRLVLLIDDEKDTCELIISVFIGLGAKVVCATDADEGLHLFFERRPQLVVVDIMLPGLDGVEVVRAIRKMSETPIVILSAAQEGQTILGCLQAGANDYVTKPVSPQELATRCSSVMRRTRLSNGRGPGGAAYSDGYLTVDLKARRLQVDGRRVKLTPTEFRLLSLLVERKGLICTFDQILDAVWGENDPGTIEKVHTFIWQLRRKIEPDPVQSQYIKSEYSIGYRFEGQPIA